ALTGVTARQTAAGASICFTLSAPAEVTAQVINIAGRPVRRFITGRPTPAGERTITWNLRSDGGSAAPAGRYLVRVRARTDDGRAVTAIAPVTVTR
ncbi:MAG: FlgD immunoglobulin-like domain containing protein, partial [Armatimonadota bacterium]